MVFGPDAPATPAWRDQLAAYHRLPEKDALDPLIARARLDAASRQQVADDAAALIRQVRAERTGYGGIDAFMHEYDLSTQEGIVLMCLAEALLRIPDPETSDALIRDKIAQTDWEAHLGNSNSIFVNASTLGLMIGGRLLRQEELPEGALQRTLRGLIQRSGEPVIRGAIRRAMAILGRHFVMGESIEEALGRRRKHYRYSFDMLGEAARTQADADAYYQRYAHALRQVGAAARGGDVTERPGISIKLSALHPRLELAKRTRVLAELPPRVLALAKIARDHNLGFCVDAEESQRLELSLEVIERVFRDPALAGWEGFGLAVQAYQKRAYPLLDVLAGWARSTGRRLMVRLVKGAYWDTEIKAAQVAGVADYPVFTRKTNTDVSYLACAYRMLGEPEAFFPQFATHNAHTVSAIRAAASDGRDYEFQRLHGMGEPLYEQLVPAAKQGLPCRVYAPVGTHEDLLAYLVRRLLENGANSSFVNRLSDDRVPIEQMVADPVAAAAAAEPKHNPNVPLPEAIYGAQRRNSRGLDLADATALAHLAGELDSVLARTSFTAQPLVAGQAREHTPAPVLDPADRQRRVGEGHSADTRDVADAMAAAARAQPEWDRLGARRRADILESAADALEADRIAFLALCVREGGKTLADANAEIREAVDFLRYYAAEARARLGAPWQLPGPTGEYNEFQPHGRGVFACISPWNQLLAIFTGQVAAALVTGNAVVAKPAEQTPLTAARMTALLHRAGVPAEILHLVPGGGDIGTALVTDPHTAGVAFTGSVTTAKAIHRRLADRPGAIVPLIAETGGMNAMIVDSSALPEQAVRDVVESAFMSAGQRCSACRILYVQADIADRVLPMLAGAMAELCVGDPGYLATDVGPVIDSSQQAMLAEHGRRMAARHSCLGRAETPAAESGHYVAPQAYEVGGIEAMGDEVFGPILHVARYRAEELDAVLDAINATGYGLTLGVHTRIDAQARYIQRRARVGNCYVNRNMVGSVVGVQPFGGEGLSGTGPKAGGPHYLQRFIAERVLTIDVTAAGGDAALLNRAGTLTQAP